MSISAGSVSRKFNRSDGLSDLGGGSCQLGPRGLAYSKSITMINDSATGFETLTKKLRDVVISVTVNDLLMGSAGAENHPVAAGQIIGMTRIDISTLLFKNKTSGQNATVTILGVED